MLFTLSSKVGKAEEHEKECSSGRLLGAVQDFFCAWLAIYLCKKKKFPQRFLHIHRDREWDPQRFRHVR